MLLLYENVRKAAQVMADVLVVGETGTGKELVSEAIHKLSPRGAGPFITINCGALDESLLMDTLFGHVKGAYTEARASRKGAFLTAQGGTLMLDEVGNAAPKVQQALLRALSTRRIRPLGSDEDVPFDTRIIAATNALLREDSQNGSFREDLYYRLAVITINTPPLRDRKADIPSLIVYFLSEALTARARQKAEAAANRPGAAAQSMGQSVIGGNQEGCSRFGQRSYAIVSDRYLNFSSRVGYHYAILDCWCGETLSKNYIRFEFAGGAAANVQRNRRVRCIGLILKELGFTVEITGDRLRARYQKYPRHGPDARSFRLHSCR